MLVGKYTERQQIHTGKCVIVHLQRLITFATYFTVCRTDNKWPVHNVEEICLFQDKHYGSAVCYGLLCINGPLGVNLEQAGNVDKHDAY